MEILTIGDFIKWKRSMVGLSQHELSDQAVACLPGVSGLQRSAVAHWEQNNRIPNHSQVRAIGDALELSPVEKDQLVELIIEAELHNA